VLYHISGLFAPIFNAKAAKEDIATSTATLAPLVWKHFNAVAVCAAVGKLWVNLNVEAVVILIVILFGAMITAARLLMIMIRVIWTE